MMFRALSTEERYLEWRTELERAGLVSPFELSPTLPALPPSRREELSLEPYREPELHTSLIQGAWPADRGQAYLVAAVALLALTLVLFWAYCAAVVGVP